MKLLAFEKKISKQEAERIAEKKGTLLWRTIFANRPLKEIRLRYIEYKIIEISMLYQITPLLRMRNNLKHFLRSILLNDGSGRSQKSQPPIILDKTVTSGEHRILILSNGTSGSPSLIDTLPEFMTIDLDEEQYEDMVQRSDYDDEEMIKNAKKLAVRVMHRMVGGIPRIGGITIKTVYRPFYVAFYGDVINGNKVRYITIPADCGYTTIRGEFS